MENVVIFWVSALLETSRWLLVSWRKRRGNRESGKYRLRRCDGIEGLLKLNSAV